MPDHASLTQGGFAVYGKLTSPPAAAAADRGGRDGGGVLFEGQLTSPTLASSELDWADYVLHMLRVPGRVWAEGGDAALSASNSLGSCFAFKGGSGTLTVKLARPPPAGGGGPPSSSAAAASERAHHHQRGFIKVTHVSIEHARAALAPTAARSAPRAFRVLGWDADPAAAAAAAAAATGSLGGVVVGGGKLRSLLPGGAGRADSGTADGAAGAGAAPLRPYVLLEGAEYQAGGGTLGVQTFPVSEGRELALPVGWVTLEMESNHGGPWTCLYGFRVHGDPVA